ncbi:MAG: response regulator transcription factor, partial [Acidobacteria bacterium]|nr:response regulator transcription factor [Acidobacteriota bacterium]
MRRPTVLLADDHEIVIEGLLRVLDPDFEVLGSVSDGAALVKAAEKLKPDLIIADITMPVLNGIEAIRRINKSLPRTAFVVLTMHLDVMYATEAIAAGATGYVLKHSIRSELLTAAHKALKGEVYVSAKIAPAVMQALAEGSYRHKSVTVKLTARQREVLQLVAEGHTIPKIAEALFISPRTVEFHKYNIMEA